VQEIIDDVNPQNTYYTLETMPWIDPDSADSYLELKKKIDRGRFAVHFDPVNIVSSTRTYYFNAQMLTESIRALGPYIRSCHAKDMNLESGMPVVIKEIIPGEGNLDYRVFVKELDRLPDDDIPLMMEHLKTEEEYDRAAVYIRKQASEAGVSI
jgi:sugar phosphate isomerase/epimerase